MVNQVFVFVHSVAQLCLTLCDPTDLARHGPSPARPSVHGIFLARILE